MAQSLQPVAADDARPTPKQLFQEKCSGCHNVPDPAVEARSAAQWRQTVDRMLYKHGAKESISPDEATTITAYLATFAPKPGAGSRMDSPDRSDVWATAPVYSRVYRFRSTQIVAPFRAVSGKWTVRDGASGPILVAAALSSAKAPAILLAPTPGPHGDLQEEAEFRPLPSDAATATVAPPVSFGLTFDTQDASNYYAARYDDAKHELALVRVTAGQETALQTAPIADGLAASPDGWHKLKVNIVEGRAKVWLDYTKRIDIALPQAPGNGSVGLWTAGKAAARTFVLDVYPTNVPNVAV